MAPIADSGNSASKRPLNNDSIDDYDVDDDPFAQLGIGATNNEPQSKKRKDATGLGIDEAVAVQKKPRAPNVKLDESRLLSAKGIPRLRRKACDLKFKGKGHEFSDTARLLSFYQLWFDDLFPKAKFLDAAAMAEKAGHKKYMRMKRMEWIDEGKPKLTSVEDYYEDLFGEPNNAPEERAPAVFPAKLAPIFQDSERAKTPARDDVPDDEDLYGATPIATRTKQPESTSLFGGADNAARPANTSLFGNGANTSHNDEPDEDDLDALMAEEEAQRTKPPAPLFGNGGNNMSQDEPDEDDLDALMAEAEAEAAPKAPSNGFDVAPKLAQTVENEEDDLDALMAEAEAEDQGQNQAKQASDETSRNQEKAPGKPENVADMDEEEAMAEMDGLW